ncbi:hypothetical protein V493_01031 [Pseudogymnoascus sp. VKM F-4281 (FW-2241)]|nr:hypothetical protein V493_01031 [Pseudogymnoascus sp. VKM F-4281 (FW-2241)]
MIFSHLHSSRICVAALILYGQWVHAGAISTPADPRATLSNKPTKTIDFSSALLLEASLAAKLRQPDNAPATPVADDIKHIPEYDTVRRLALMWPPIQEGIGLTDSQNMISEYLSAKINDSVSDTGAGSALDSRQGGLKVMVAGDSMTQGLEGDWTWRYRLWQWFKQNGVSVQFVGPYKGTVPAAKPSQPQPPSLYGTPLVSSLYPDNGGYAKGVDGAFLSNSNHFAIWGRAAAVSKGLVKAAMQQSPADLMLIMLGFNDMGWFYSDAYGTIDSIATLIANARSVNPNIKFAVATVPQRKFIGGREDLVENTNIYNNLLPGSIAKWTTSQSPVYLVDLSNNYDCRPGGCEAGYDGLHPNAWGEFEIASAFTKTLFNDLKLGSGPLAVPDRNDPSLVRDLPAPSNLQVFSSPQGVTATWDPVYGARSYDITVTINGGLNAWSATMSQSNRWDSQWSIDGWEYAVSVRASAGDAIKGPYTDTKTAVAKPQLAPPPDNINVNATAGGITVTWNPPTGAYSDSIVEYNVIYWDWKADHCQYTSGAAFKSSPAVITNLTLGANYLVAVVTWNKNGQGFPYIANNAVPGAGTPAVPSGLVVQSQDQTSVRITWSGSASAGGYHVWARNIKEAGSKLHLIGNVTEETCNEQYVLFPGVWNYAFAVSAFNGNDETVTGPEMVAPSTDVQAGKGTGPKCPAKEPWCPSGAFSIPPGDWPRLAAVSFPDNTCNSENQSSIVQELQYALEMAAETQANTQRGEYFTTFFDAESRANPDFHRNAANVYKNIGDMLKGIRYKVTVTCDITTTECTKKKFIAHMNDDNAKKVGRVNLCDRFWTDERIVSTESILSTCQTQTRSIVDAQRSRSAILLHEMTHTMIAMDYNKKTYDYAYGYTFCRQLAENRFDRSCMLQKMDGKGHKFLCPDKTTGAESMCDAKLSVRNADTYSFVGTGVWFSSKCDAAITLPLMPPNKSTRGRRATCPATSDSIFFDEESPIVGSYVHFGDSYGAGMGTGTTTTDKCRVGSNNFGKLLYAWMDDASIHYEEKVCSGDTLEGLAGQISSWSNPDSASLGTLSIGGNDVGFSDIAYNCVITPNTVHWGSTNRGYCTDAEKKAVDYMSDTGTSGLRLRLKEAYLSILKKSGQDFFHLYVTSYVNFFNAATTDCNDTSFHYHWGGYKPSPDWPIGRIVYLSTDLRSELNALVDKLNTVIAGAVSDANAEHGLAQVHFVDLAKSFDNGHRWCENPKGEFHEPNPSRDDTWFFLSGWGDVSIDAAGASTTNSTEDAELASIVSTGKIPLPDAKTCYAALGTDPDPYAVAMCRVSITISDDPSGPEAVRYRSASASIASGDFEAQEVSWYYPTRQIKTFHPRSNGMVAYRDAIITAIKEVGQA